MKNIKNNLTSNKQIIIQAKAGGRNDSHGSGSYRDISFRKGNNNFISETKFDHQNEVIQEEDEGLRANVKNTPEMCSRAQNGSTVTQKIENSENESQRCAESPDVEERRASETTGKLFINENGIVDMVQNSCAYELVRQKQNGIVDSLEKTL